MLIPPLDRVHRRALQQDSEVQVIAAGQSSLAGSSELLSFRDRITDLDADHDRCA